MSGRLGEALYSGTHDLHNSSLFSDDGLAELLDLYPRDRLGIYRFPDLDHHARRAEHGRAPDLSGRELLAAVREGCIWLNLRAVNRELPHYETVAEHVFGALGKAGGARILKPDVGVLISSPLIHVHYHLDIPLVCLVQLRGTKTLHVYPRGKPFVDPDEIAGLVLRTRDEQMRYDPAFDAHATAVELSPGRMVTWPQTAPHRVSNGPSLNVSLSCEFMTPSAILRANALHTNAELRARGRNVDAFPERLGAGTLLKAGAARVLKRVHPVPDRSPVPVTFELGRNTIVPVTPEAAHTAKLSCKVVEPSALSDRDRKEWTALLDHQASESSSLPPSPLLRPEFADLVARVRGDVRCILVRQDAQQGAHQNPREHGQLVAVLAAHERAVGLLRPVGAPFCDYAGPVVAPDSGVTVERILELSGHAAFRSATTLASSSAQGFETSCAVHLPDGNAARYLESRRALHAKRFKNFRRLQSKLEREHGSVVFIHGAATEMSDHLHTLLGWKSEQFRREALVDLVHASHTRPLLDEVARTVRGGDNALGGFLTGLLVDGRLAAAHFGVRDAQTFHPWIASYDPALGDYSPGILLLHRAVEAMPDMGLRVYDLAGGHDHYKKYFADTGRTTRPVDATRPTWWGRAQAVGFGGWNVLGARRPSAPAARMRRRFDHIAVCEPGAFRRGAEALRALRRMSR